MEHEEPSTEITLYSWIDDSLRDRPADADLGDTWRSEEVYRCRICHTKTNRWEIGGYPSSGPRIYCPANRSGGDTIYEMQEDEEHEKKHDELRELLSRREELTDRLDQYDTTTSAGERTRERLHDELEVLDDQIADLRDWFGNRFDDVVGADPANQPVIDGLSPGY